MTGDQQRVVNIALTANLFILSDHLFENRILLITLSQFPTSYSTFLLVLLQTAVLYLILQFLVTYVSFTYCF